MLKPIEIISEKKLRVMLHTSDGGSTLFIRLAESHEALREQLREANVEASRFEMITRNQDTQIRRLSDALQVINESDIRHSTRAWMRAVIRQALAEGESDG